jgi:hypothetical protein
MYHQVNCSVIWYLVKELMLIQRRWRPSTNCNHLKPEEIQMLADMMAAQSRFISKSRENGMPFYKLLGKAAGFQLNDQAMMVFIEPK